jgi:hypothetical protein
LLAARASKRKTLMFYIPTAYLQRETHHLWLYAVAPNQRSYY